MRQSPYVQLRFFGTDGIDRPIWHDKQGRTYMSPCSIPHEYNIAYTVDTWNDDSDMNMFYINEIWRVPGIVDDVRELGAHIDPQFISFRY